MRKYQEDRIKIIKEILPLLGDNFILKGGTALSLYYNLDRYSEDIDLDSKSNNMNFIDRIANYNKEWRVSIKKNIDTVFRAMVDYGATNHQGPYPLKIEVSSRNIGMIKNKVLSYKTVNRVNVYEVADIIQMKVATFAKRDKIRDLYDIGFLLDKYPTLFSKENLLTIYDNMGYKGLDYLSLLLQDEMDRNNLKQIDADGYVLQIYEICEKLIIKANNRGIIWGE